MGTKDARHRGRLPQGRPQRRRLCHPPRPSVPLEARRRLMTGPAIALEHQHRVRGHAQRRLHSLRGRHVELTLMISCIETAKLDPIHALEAEPEIAERGKGAESRPAPARVGPSDEGREMDRPGVARESHVSHAVRSVQAEVGDCGETLLWGSPVSSTRYRRAFKLQDQREMQRRRPFSARKGKRRDPLERGPRLRPRKRERGTGQGPQLESS